uniref:Galactosylgalactosylxylosylprotein 3-beta-glucuronosyltransferase n=1 Tax=Strigamia maritima TaxID=126957 RepID=T1J0L0_STRMM
MRLWLDDNIKENLKACNDEENYFKLQLVEYKLKIKRLKQLVLPHLPNDFNLEHFIENQSGLPTIYAITPTYLRPTQKAELTRLSQSFLLIPNFHWIVVEDSREKTDKVSKLLRRSSLSYTHLNIATPAKYKLSDVDPSWLKPRGVIQRNLGITWLREHFTPKTANGVVYFADDDNTYDIRLFEEMRYTKRVSVWPVGLVGGLLLEGPVVQNNTVTGWITAWKTNRPFAIDMAGFAVNLSFLLEHPKASYNLTVPRGYQESYFLQKLVSLDQLEPKASKCTMVLVWHTRTEKAKLNNELVLQQRGQHSNHGVEV